MRIVITSDIISGKNYLIQISFRTIKHLIKLSFLYRRVFCVPYLYYLIFIHGHYTFFRQISRCANCGTGPTTQRSWATASSTSSPPPTLCTVTGAYSTRSTCRAWRGPPGAYPLGARGTGPSKLLAVRNLRDFVKEQGVSNIWFRSKADCRIGNWKWVGFDYDKQFCYDHSDDGISPKLYCPSAVYELTWKPSKALRYFESQGNIFLFSTLQ